MWQNATRARADEAQLRSNVIGIEYDFETYNKMLANLKETGRCIPKNLLNKDFFDLSPEKKLESYAGIDHKFPLVTATVGNPPYVERQRLKNFGKIRKKVSSSEYDSIALSSLTDIYGYFLIHLSRFLKPNGKLALIISDTWLNMRFGIKLKEFLLSNFKIKAIVGFRARARLLMQCIKGCSTLRVSSKRDKSPPRIVFRHGRQDRNVKDFLKNRKIIKRIGAKLQNNR